MDPAGGSLDASKIDVEDLEDQEFEPDEGEEFRVEGYVSGYDGPPDTEFGVGNINVRIDANTQIEGGVLRITSYNVCYTKLLRKKLVEKGEMP